MSVSLRPAIGGAPEDASIDGSAPVFVALGSNLGDRLGTLLAAVEELDRLPMTRVERRSRFIETEPEGPPGQGPYLNGVAQLRSRLEPRPLLEALLAIEHRHGRRRASEQPQGPRTLDLDLLLHGQRVLREGDLVLPHPRMHQRHFVLAPLAEIAPRTLHPLLHASVESLLRATRTGSSDIRSETTSTTSSTERTVRSAPSGRGGWSGFG